MKIDVYTKTILTVIAAALVYLCCLHNVDNVRADEPQQVLVVNGAPGQPDLTIPISGSVNVTNQLQVATGNDPLSVQLVRVNKTSTGQQQWLADRPLEVRVVPGEK